MAPTEINAVVAAVVMIVVLGIGTSMSVNGIATICASGGVICCAVGVFVSTLGAGSELIPSIPGGGLSVLGGTTSGL